MDNLRVERADNCIWLIDDRGKHQEVHLTPGQAKEYGQKLIDVSTKSQENVDKVGIEIVNNVIGYLKETENG